MSMEVNNIKGYVYKITNPSGKIYIGQTINLKVRKNKYKYLNCKNQTRLYKSLLKYGWENHVFEVLETINIIDNQDLNILEIKYIKQYNSFLKGLNCTLGGQGGSGKVYSEESKLKMRNSQLGKKQSKETINKRIEKLKGQKRSQEFRELRRKYRTNAVMSDETKEKLRKHNLGKPSPNRIKCRLINLQTNETWEADSMMQLSKTSPLSISTLVRLKANKVGKKVKNSYNLEYN